MTATATATAPSPARLAANRANALRSSGPKTEAGKAASRANAYKHGLTGSGVVAPADDLDEVDRVLEGVRSEVSPSGVVGEAMARRVATMIVRLDRCVAHETATLAARVREAAEAFEAPEGADPSTVDRLRAEAADRALFDPSKEATLARKYEAAADRGLFRALKELRQLGRDPAPPENPVERAAAEAQASLARMGSFFQADLPPKKAPTLTPPAPSKPPGRPSMPFDQPRPDAFDLPFAIGRAR